MKIRKSSKRPVKASKRMKLGRKIMASASGSVALKTVTSDGSYYLIKSATKKNSFWSTDIDKANAFAKAESAINKLYSVISRLSEYAFYNEDDMYDLEDESDLKKVKFAKFYITDMSGTVIEDISDDVKQHLLSDGSFIEDVLGDMDDIEESTKIRASRVMAAKRSIHFTVTVTDTDEIIDVLEDQDEAIEVARKYTQKYGDSATVEKEWIGSDGEVYDSTVCFQTDSDFNSSTKITKRPIKAFRPIMAGPGAGCIVEWNLDSVDSMKFIKPISTEVNEYGEVCVDAECDIEIGLTINAASSYYEGADSLDIETTATISRIYLEIPVADYETPEDVIAQIPYMGATDLDSIFYDIGALGAWKSNLGGGYTHSTFNGVLADADDPHSVSEGFDGWTVTLTDKEVIDYIDRVVTGEDTYTGYALYDQDGEYIDKFEDLIDAQNKAEELIASGDYESIECVREETKIYFDGTSEEVYNETEFVIDEPADI